MNQLELIVGDVLKGVGVVLVVWILAKLKSRKPPAKKDAPPE